MAFEQSVDVRTGIVTRTEIKLSQEEFAAAAAAHAAALQSEIVATAQARLDTFAATRGYDGILSACTYTASGIEQFKTEGQYCVNARDQTWAALYGLLAEVQAGTRTMPTGFADIEPMLPVLVWPQ